MAVSTTLTDSFILDLFTADSPDFNGTPNLFLALIKSGEARTYNEATTNLSELQQATTDEVANGNGYTTNGAAVSVEAGYPQLIAGVTTGVDFVNTQWLSATFDTSGGLLYHTAANDSCAVYAFTASPSNGTLTIQWPTPAASTAAIYINRA